jgi:hypothetical protein
MRAKFKPMLAPALEPEHDVLEAMSLRIKAIADKLNTYIQANGCSDKLKRKSRQALAEISK